MKIRNMWAWAVVAVLAVGCSGTPEGGETPGDPTGGEQEQVDPSQDTYTLVADKESIDADGVQKVTFSFLNGKGENLCEKEPGMVKVTNETTGTWLGYGKHAYTSVRNGDYVFSATWRGYAASNTVKVRVENRAKIEKYRQTVVVFKATGAWCSACPKMTASLHEAEEEWGNQMVVVACHGGGPDPFKLSPDVSELVLAQWKGNSYPSCVYDNNVLVSGAKEVDNVKENLIKQISKYPATCGVKITQTSLVGNTLTVRASLQSDKGGDYDLGCVLLEDDLRYSGGMEPSGVYSDVMRAVSGSFNYYNKDTAVSVSASGEASKEFVVEGVTVSNAQNCRVLVYALTRLSNGQTITDNAAVCKLGESMEGYVLND